MNETSKTKRIWTDFERSLLVGDGIDIGCGSDPVLDNVRRFDVQDGDANDIIKHVSQTFDFVYSSHCLEHMNDIPKAMSGWWELVKPGGIMMVIVPDEDLYEQGVFPSRFNPDHKATFTISKARSWSPRSYNLMELALGLPRAELVGITLQDVGYDRALMVHGERPCRGLHAFLRRVGWFWERRVGVRPSIVDRLIQIVGPIDQTMGTQALAQIQCIIRKARSGEDSERFQRA
jgi:SAM-dependent methyltransferase